MMVMVLNLISTLWYNLLFIQLQVTINRYAEVKHTQYCGLFLFCLFFHQNHRQSTKIQRIGLVKLVLGCECDPFTWLVGWGGGGGGFMRIWSSRSI